MACRLFGINNVFRKLQSHHLKQRLPIINLAVGKQFRIGNDDTTTDKIIIFNKFNDFFIKVGLTLARAISISKNKPSDYAGQSFSETVFLVPVTQEEITLKIKSLKYTATGYDDINAMS